jgi:sulfotransferase family protein
VKRWRARLRGVRVAPRLPAPPLVNEQEWRGLRETMQARAPGVIGATGGSGTRVVARIVQQSGMFIGADRNRSEDALDFAAFSDRWVNAFTAGERPPELVAELRALVARQARAAADHPWGWKEPRSIYLLPLLDDELPGLRFLHLVRDGRDMAYSENQVQLRKHGDALLGDDDGRSAALRSISLWRDVNLRAADYGEQRLGSRYLRLRFEDLCMYPVAGVGEILDFFGLAGDGERIAAEEVAAPETLGRWRLQDAASVAALEAEAGAALERFGYQSPSA